MRTFAESRSRLLRLLQEKSVFHGDFVLSSGQRSAYYIDCRLTTLHPEGAHLVGEVMFKLIEQEISSSGAKIAAVGGLTMGADPIALSVSMRSFTEHPRSPLYCFVVRKGAKDHGKGKQIEGNFKRGDTVVVIDDVITSGESTLKAIDAVQQEGGKVAFAAVLVDRQQGGRQNIEQRGFKVIAAFTRDELLGPLPSTE